MSVMTVHATISRCFLSDDATATRLARWAGACVLACLLVGGATEAWAQVPGSASVSEQPPAPEHASDSSLTALEQQAQPGVQLRDTRSWRARPVQDTPDGGVEQGGRVRLLVNTTVLGGTESALLVTALGGNERAVGAAALIGAAGGFFVPLLTTDDARVTRAAGVLTGYGGLQGYIHAAQLTGILGGANTPGRVYAGVGALLGGGEAVAGYILGNRSGWSGGTAEMITYNGLYGTLTGFTLASIIFGNDLVVDDRAVQTRGRIATGLSFLGSLGGAYLGYRMGEAGGYTQGDARIYALGGLLGPSLMAALLEPTGVQGPRVGSTLLLASNVGGLLAGRALVGGRDFTPAQGSLVTLGTFAGGLFGSGLSTILDTSPEATQIVGSLSAIAGYAGTYLFFERSARVDSDASASASGFDVEVHPGGVAQSVLGDRLLPQPERVDRLPASAVTLSYSF
jgi:hypothetical protein